MPLEEATGLLTLSCKFKLLPLSTAAAEVELKLADIDILLAVVVKVTLLTISLPELVL